jgi:putative ABC transport system permease protein
MMLRLLVALLRLIALVVPRGERDAWLQEWEAEVRARWQRLAVRNELNGSQQMDMLRRTLGSVHDAAWLRRQFTHDADLVHDLRHGLRLLWRSPGFAMLAILVLALGIGTTVGIFSVFDTLLVRPLPYRDADRVLMLWQGSISDPRVRDDVSPANFLDWRDHLTSFEVVAAVAPSAFDYAEGREPQVLMAAVVSEGFFRAIGVDAALGRTFTADEYLRGRNRVIVISHRLWQTIFAGDPRVVGRSVQLDGNAFTVVGVLPPSFQPRLLQSFSDRGIYVPKVFQEYESRIRGSGYWNVVGRLKQGVSIEAAQAELDALSTRLAEQYPRTNATVVARAQALRDHLAGNLRPALRLLLVAVGFLLLIAAANVANLLLARAARRSRELAVRSAIGAGRGRLVRQLLAESLLLAALGSLAGLLVAWWTVRLIVQLVPVHIPGLADVGVDARVIAFAIALTAIVAIVVGLVPAWRCSGQRLIEILRVAPSSSGTGGHSLQASIVVAEVALALLLMTGAGLLLRSFAALLETDAGFNPDRVVALQVFAWDRNTTPEKRVAFIQQVQDRMRDVPHVQSVGAASAMPFIEANINIETPVLVEGRPLPQGEEASAFLTFATPGYFQTMGIPLLEGRLIDTHDTARATPVVAVSEALARRAWPAGNAVGSRITYRYEGQQRTAAVIGIVGDVRHDALDRPPRPELFVPHAQAPFGSMTFVARTTADPATAIAALKSEIYAVDPAQAIYRAATAEELVSRSLTERRFMLSLLSAFAILSGLLAAIGIYGVISVATTQRTREFGVRLALGAKPSEILRLVLRQGGVMTLLGVTIGLAAALAFGRVMSAFLYEVRPTDPLTLGGVVFALLAVAFAACAIPAHRATRVDPLVAIRSE